MPEIKCWTSSGQEPWRKNSTKLWVTGGVKTWRLKTGFLFYYYFFFRKGQTTSRAIGGKAKIVYFFASGSNPFLKTRAWRIFARLYAVLIIVKLSFIRFGCCEILSRFSCTFSVNAHLTKSSTEISLIYIKKLF